MRFSYRKIGIIFLNKNNVLKQFNISTHTSTFIKKIYKAYILLLLSKNWRPQGLLDLRDQ